MNQQPVTLIQIQGSRAVSDLSPAKRNAILSLHEAGHSASDIADSMDISRTSVYNVINNKGGKRQKQRADRYEAFFKDSNSGCYMNGELMPSEDQLRMGNPLDQLILEEEVTNRLIEGARNGS